jgi:hypothetical protein
MASDAPPKPKQPKSARYIQEFNKHEPHPDCPDTLACLPDTDGRPQHTLPVILRCAILGSPRRRLTIREIYAAMEDKYSYYKTAGPTWKVTRFLICFTADNVSHICPLLDSNPYDIICL